MHCTHLSNTRTQLPVHVSMAYCRLNVCLTGLSMTDMCQCDVNHRVSNICVYAVFNISIHSLHSELHTKRDCRHCTTLHTWLHYPRHYATLHSVFHCLDWCRCFGQFVQSRVDLSSAGGSPRRFLCCSSLCRPSSRPSACWEPALWAASVAVMSIWAYLLELLPTDNKHKREVKFMKTSISDGLRKSCLKCMSKDIHKVTNHFSFK